MRDFYDVYEIMKTKEETIEKALLKEAFEATCRKREIMLTKEEIEQTLHAIEVDAELEEMNKILQRSFSVKQ